MCVSCREDVERFRVYNAWVSAALSRGPSGQLSIRLIEAFRMVHPWTTGVRSPRTGNDVIDKESLFSPFVVTKAQMGNWQCSASLPTSEQ